jgi:hypothetical protein
MGNGKLENDLNSGDERKVAIKCWMWLIGGGPTFTESRLHDVAARAAQVIGGLNLFLAVRGFFFVKSPFSSRKR